MFKWIGLIGLGSAIGGIARFIISYLTLSYQYKNFPLGTFIVNVLGCFLMGILFQMITGNLWSDSFKLFLLTGILGGFTTFSAFSFESIHLIQNNHYTIALLYVISSITIGLLSTWSGLVLMKSVLS